MTTILQYGSKYFAIDWYCGLTEYQDNYYPNQPYEVAKKEKVITTHYYERKVKDDD